MRYFLLLVIASLPVCSPAQGLGVNGVHSIYNNNESFLDVDEGDFVVNDLAIDFSGQLGGQQILVKLSQGSIYQHFVGGDTPPNETFIGVVPSLEYDSFVAMGGFTTTTSENVGVFGGAVNLGGESAVRFDETGANITWAPNVGIVVTSSIEFPIARLTLSGDAVGTFSYLGTVLGESDPFRVTTRILQGRIDNFLLPSGELSALHVTPRNDIDGVSVDGVKINDVSIDFDGVLESQIVSIELTEGSVYQDAINDDKPPAPSLLDVSPQSIVDTFLALGSDNRDKNPDFYHQDCLYAGSGADFCQHWYSDATNPVDSRDYFVGRIALSDDAVGRFTYKAAAGGAFYSYEGWIENGTIYLVPEPAACWLLVVAGLGWRRRQLR